MKKADCQQRFTGGAAEDVSFRATDRGCLLSRRGSGQSAAFTAGIYATRTFQVGYFVIIRRGAVGVGAAGEITNVTHVFQPSGRFSAANSL